MEEVREGTLMGTENAVSIIVGSAAGPSSRVYIRDTSFTEIIRAVRWAHSRLHGSQFSFRGFA